MLLNPLTFHAPKTLIEAVKLYAKLDNAKLQAGGTFLLNSLKLLKRNHAKTPEHIISLQNIDELKGITANNDQLIIKAMTGITDIFESEHLDDNFSVLKTVCRNISTTPIRNMASIGGNLTCRYTWTEMPAVMIGLNAKFHFVDTEGKEAALDPESFFKNAAKTDKVLSHITIERNTKSTVAYRRVKKTVHVDIPLLSLLIQTTFEGDRFTQTRVAVNNCVDFAQRDQKLEEFLNNNSCSQSLSQDALDHLDHSIYDKRSNDYKKHMFRVSIKSALEELIANRKSK